VSIHLHRARQWTGWMLGAVAMSPFALCLDSPARVSGMVPITGRVTYAGRPLGDAIMCLDRNDLHVAFAPLQADGSFRVVGMSWDEEGALPGRYCAHMYTHTGGPKFPSRYGDPRTSGIELDVEPGWNHFHISMQDSPGEPPR
jgi:hypothetical protein